jgi:hypothetical protein
MSEVENLTNSILQSENYNAPSPIILINQNYNPNQEQNNINNNTNLEINYNDNINNNQIKNPIIITNFDLPKSNNTLNNNKILPQYYLQNNKLYNKNYQMNNYNLNCRCKIIRLFFAIIIIIYLMWEINYLIKVDILFKSVLYHLDQFIMLLSAIFLALSYYYEKKCYRTTSMILIFSDLFIGTFFRVIAIMIDNEISKGFVLVLPKIVIIFFAVGFTANC